MISKQRLFLSLKCIFVFFLVFGVFFFVPKALSRYQSISDSHANVDIAFYIISSSMQTESLVMKEIGPTSEPYIYTFSVSNFEGAKRLETKAKYKIKITSTTNIPFVYEIYSQDATKKTNISLGERIESDSDGMYFRIIETADFEFDYVSDQTNLYQLYIYYPEGYDTYEYQNIVENINITIDSKQMIESDEI